MALKCWVGYADDIMGVFCGFQYIGVGKETSMFHIFCKIVPAV